MDEIGLFDAIYTQRAIRSFKSDPVPDELIEKVVEAATKAPSGGNSQPWAFIVVRDPQVRAELTAIGKHTFDGMYQAALGRAQPGDPPPFPKLKKMVDQIDDIPVWIVVCLTTPGSPGAYGSIWPAVQNLLLAAPRARARRRADRPVRRPVPRPDEEGPRGSGRRRACCIHPARLPGQEPVWPHDAAPAVRGPALGALGGREGEHGEDAVPPLRFPI